MTAAGTAVLQRPSLRVPLRVPAFRGLLTALAISMAGDWLYNVAVLVFVYDRTQSSAWLAAATVVQLLPRVLFGAAGGAVADRFPRRAVMIVSDIVRLAIMLGLAAVASSAGPVEVALALVGASTLAGAPFMPAVTATIPSLLPESQLAAANTLVKTVEHAAVVLGPAVGALLLAAVSPAGAFAINGGTFLASAAIVAAVRFDTGRGEVATRRAASSRRVREGLLALLRAPVAAVLVGCVMVGSAIYGTERVLLVPISSSKLGTGSAGAGYLLGAVGLGGVAAAGFTSRLANQRHAIRPMIIAVFAMGLPLMALAWVSLPVVAVLLMTAQGAGNITADVIAITVMQRSVPAEVMGRAAGTFEALFIGAILLGSVVAPPLVDALGLDGALVLFGLAFPALTLLGLPILAGADRTAQETVRRLAPEVRLLEQLPLFTGLPRQSLERLAAAAREETVAPGTTVVREGFPATDFHVVSEGILDVTVSRGRRVPEVVNVLYAGDHFGEIGLLRAVPRTASVVTRTPCRVLSIDGEVFLSVVYQSTALSGTLWDGAVGRLARTQAAARPATAGEAWR